MRTMAKPSRCASMNEAIASRIEWQLHACATPQRPPPLCRLASTEYCFKEHNVASFGPKDGFVFLSIPVQEIPEKDG